ncbi:MAG: MarC family protein [Deltaproteobacteria bacterium]|nr:MarC family protein [Deltaproteobacteria bacterium]
MKNFWLCFVPVFVAVNAIGMLPLYVSITSSIRKPWIRRLLFQSFLTASIVASVFIFVGQAVFRLLGITVADFMVAGGILLFIIAMTDLTTGRTIRERSVDPSSFGAVPIGVPLIVGPAVLTTVLLLAQEYGHFLTVLSTIINVLLAVLIFGASSLVTRAIGKSGMQTISKVANLILAAIAVMIVRKGITGFKGL